MGAKTYTIGDLARLTGQPVRRIRFYSDKGLLPPTLRSASNYRFYTDADVAKLDMLEAEIAGKHRMAAVIRATLRVPDPAESDLKRIWTMSNLSNQQMKARVDGFIEAIAAGTTLTGEWRLQVLDLSAPELPEAPTPEQLAAWDELSVLLSDPDFQREVRESTKAF